MSGKMSTRARKAKGRALQNLVVTKLYLAADKVIAVPTLGKGDIKGAIMGETGADIKFSPAAKEVFPLNIECKNQEKYKSIYNAYEQVDLNEDAGESILVIKSNRKQPLAIINADKFFKLLYENIQLYSKVKNLEEYSELLYKLP